MNDLKEFRINNYITVKLENDITFIYVGDQKFKQCKQLLFTIHGKKAESFNEISSIDEFEGNFRSWSKSDISPIDEFWGHCSNLQAWSEYNYDTRLLHRNLAFPLLKKLAEVGDPKATKIFKNEIATRFSSAYPSVVTFLVKEGYLNFMNSEELDLLIEELFTARFIYALQELVRGFYSRLKKYIKKGNYENLLLKVYKDVINQKNHDLEIICWNIIQKIISIELQKQFPVEKDKFILWIEEKNGIKRIKDLRLSGKQKKKIMDIKEVFGWKFLGGLKDVKLNDFKISDFSYFENCLELERLDMIDCEIESIIGIERLENLKFININSCSFPKIYNFGNLEKLTELELVNCDIIEIMGLEGLNKLKILDLSDNQIDCIKGLDSLRKLKKLILDSNLIKKINGLNSLTNLEKLTLDHNLIQKIEELGNLTNLTELDLASNKLSKIENLNELIKLEILYLSYNKISKIENLEKLSNLKIIGLMHNQIKNIESLKKLKFLKIINLDGNPLPNDEYHNQIIKTGKIPKI